MPVLRRRPRPEGGGLPAQAGHEGRPDPRREQHAGRLADVAARPHEVDYEVVTADDYDKLDALYDTILMPDGITQARIVSGLNLTRCPSASTGRAASARRAGTSSPRSCGRRHAGRRSAPPATRAKQLLNLPAEKVQLPTAVRDPGLAACACSPTRRVPEMWGMPREWTTWSDGDTGWRITDTATAKAGSIYPNDAAPLLGAGYAAGVDGCAATPTSPRSRSAKGTWSSRPRTSTSAPGRAWPGP